VITQPIVILHTDAPCTVQSVVSKSHPDLTLHTCHSYAALPEMIAQTRAEVIYSVRFAGTPGFPRDAILSSNSVKWVSVGGSGTDHLAQWDASRLVVTNAAGVAADMMAEYALGMTLAFSLNLGEFARAQAEQRWIAGRVTPIAGQTVLILGLGHTGEAAAHRFKAMGMTVLGLRARPQPNSFTDEVHGLDALASLLPRADFILCCVPLLDSTRALLDAAAFAAMKPNAVLIDVSRGGVVEQSAMIRALTTDRIRGAALDVFAVEPLAPDNPLWRMPNVIITPHCSSVFEGWELKSAGMFAENLARYRRGAALHNIVDPTRGY